MVLLMSFSPSTFTIEIDAVPTVAFQAKWQADADRVCKDWLHTHWEKISAKGPGGIEMPPIFKLRLARTAEKAAYEAEGTGFEFCGEVKIVKLHEVCDNDRTEAQDLSGVGSRREVAEGLSTQHDVED